MNGGAVLEQAKIIARQGGEAHYEKAQKILMEYLKSNPQDTDAWLLLIRIECNSPLYDYDRIVHYVEHVLFYDPTNAYALLFLAYADYYLRGQISGATYGKLGLAKNDDFEVMAMIEVAKARYFKGKKDIKRYEEALKNSTNYSFNQQINLSMLGKFYINQEKIREGKSLIRKAIKNIKMINAKWDKASLECWYNYYYKGIEVPQWMYNDLLLLIQ